MRFLITSYLLCNNEQTIKLYNATETYKNNKNINIVKKKDIKTNKKNSQTIDWFRFWFWEAWFRFSKVEGIQIG